MKLNPVREWILMPNVWDGLTFRQHVKTILPDVEFPQSMKPPHLSWQHLDLIAADVLQRETKCRIWQWDNIPRSIKCTADTHTAHQFHQLFGLADVLWDGH